MITELDMKKRPIPIGLAVPVPLMVGRGAPGGAVLGGSEICTGAMVSPGKVKTW
jgi:hypothetical protein